MSFSMGFPMGFPWISRKEARLASSVECSRGQGAEGAEGPPKRLMLSSD
jgi:hypothetical protein